MADNPQMFGVRQTNGLTVNVVVPSGVPVDTNNLPPTVVSKGEVMPPAPANAPPPLPAGVEALITAQTARGAGTEMVPMQFAQPGQPAEAPEINLTAMVEDVKPAEAIPGMFPATTGGTPPPLGSVPGGMDNQPNAPGVLLTGGNQDGTVEAARANDGTLPDDKVPPPGGTEVVSPDDTSGGGNPDEVDPDKVEAPARTTRTRRTSVTEADNTTDAPQE